MADVSVAWNRIVKWLESNAVDVLSQHQPPASDEAIAQLELTVGASFPDELKQFYKLVDGDNPDEASCGIFPSVDDFDQMAYGPLALSQITREWEIQKELLEGGDFEGCEPDEVDAGIRDDSWNTGWIPFAGNGGGDLYCIDLAPAEGGTAGQVISHNHETCDHHLLAASLGEFLTKLADRLEAGELLFSEDWGICVEE